MAWGVLFTTGCISPVLGNYKQQQSSPNPTPGPLYNGTEGRDGSEFQTTRFPGDRLDEKSTAANFSIQLTSAKGRRWREMERGAVAGRRWGKDSAEDRGGGILIANAHGTVESQPSLKTDPLPGNNQVWLLTFRFKVKKCKSPQTST